VLYGCADGPAGPNGPGSLFCAPHPACQPTGIGAFVRGLAAAAFSASSGPWKASRQQAAAARMITIGGMTVHLAHWGM
jgi:hypothetical protein